MEERVDFTNDLARFTYHFLENHFGESPASLEIFNKPPFTLIHLQGFLMPSEKLLLQKDKSTYVMETRDLLMQSLKADFIQEFEKITNKKTVEFYADWNLENESGMFLAVSDQEVLPADFEWPAGTEAESVHEIIKLNSQRTQKLPDQINYFWLADNLLVIERQGILIDIEKQLIANGVMEELRLAKRPLEHRIIKLFNLQPYLNGTIKELYVDWDFKMDKGYMVLLMEKDN
ncbi:Na-translocating system protein MpsC family protein [Planococcus sp. CAU13]|uniref:Na-translocating system protein MpsC family protein n=1 Tax=Planococcus sp. CAU13 TaxID=1541197 RepID=UPI00068988C6|nr:Na-translocating system protein MpsC family protein [Planococcus sp. CAU13]